MKTLRPKLTYANVVATLALLIAVGGASAFAATQLAKNSVGSKQLKKNAVTTAKIKKQAVTAAKVKEGTLTGTQINASTLGTVPSAQTAQTANTLAPGEGWHVVGAPGEPAFEPGWESRPIPVDPNVAYYRDHEGIVHLRGVATGGGSGAIFRLPPGFRPTRGKILSFPVECSGSGGSCNIVNLGGVAIAGSGLPTEGQLLIAPGTTELVLDPITFRAES
jgi:hypothetical protein